MIKKNKWLLLLTSVCILLPILAGLALWDQLPEQMPVHWDINGNVDGHTSRSVAVFVLPCFLLAIHWFGILFTAADPKHKNIQGQPLTIAFWICPGISIFVSTMIYTQAMGFTADVQTLMPMVLGLLFFLIGNYMPKCRPNYSIGIKISWTLNDEDNWRSTHRFAGIVWTAGGLVMMLSGLVGGLVLIFIVATLITLLPILYSYLYYRKHSAKEES